MKREFAALMATVFLVSAIAFQLMGWSNMACVSGLAGVAAWWKSGYRVHIEDEE